MKNYVYYKNFNFKSVCQDKKNHMKNEVLEIGRN